MDFVYIKLSHFIWTQLNGTFLYTYWEHRINSYCELYFISWGRPDENMLRTSVVTDIVVVDAFRRHGIGMWITLRYMRTGPKLNLIITLAADVLAPNGAKPSAGIMLTGNLDMFSFEFRWFPMIPRHFLRTGDVIQNGRRNQAALQGLYSLRRRRLTGVGIPIINLRRSDDRLRFIMGIPILISILLSE